MDAKRCDVCGEFYIENNNRHCLAGIDECMTGIKTLFDDHEDEWMDLCDTCIEKFTAWVNGEAEIVMAGEIHNADADHDGCSQNSIDKYTKMTNADRIRSMTDEELAKIVDCACAGLGEYCRGEGGCDKCMLRWLRSEAEDETD